MVSHRGLVAWSTIRHVSGQSPSSEENENDVTVDSEHPGVTVNYWASARAAAGLAREIVPADDLATLLAEISRRHRDSDRFDDVMATCSILVGDTPVGARPHDEVTLHPGDTVELLPPFAGG